MSESDIDEFGIKKIYVSSIRSDAPTPFVMGKGNWKDRTDQWNGEFSGSFPDLEFLSKDTKAQRLNIFSRNNEVKVPKKAKELDRKILMDRPDKDGTKRGGWMFDSDDWRDYEITAVVFFPESNAKDTSAWYGRGAKHTGETIDSGSQGSAYKPDLWYSGNFGGWSILKETIHFDPFKSTNEKTARGREKGTDNNILESNNFSNVKEKWIGIKTVVYNEESKQSDDGSIYWPVILETYISECDSNGTPDNNWKLGIKAKDDPQQFGPWSSLPNDQPGPKTHTISWGGPIITCRTDRKSGTGGGYPNMKIKKVSIREIQPGVKFSI